MPRTLGALGVLLALIAIIGRFVKQPSITLLGWTFQASSILILANTFLLLAVFCHLMSRGSEK